MSFDPRHLLIVTVLLHSTFALADELEPVLQSALSINAERINAIEQNREENWLVHGYSNREQRFSPISQINVSNVGELGLAGYFDTVYNRGLEATPIVVDGVMYVTGSWSMVYALDASNGKLLWQHDPKVPREWAKMACCDVVNRGPAVWEGKVYVGTLDGRLLALDAASGELVWETWTVDQPLDKNYPYTITGAPRVFKGKVIIGNGGAEYGVRGYVGAYDAKTGEKVWRFYTVPGNPADGLENKAMEKAAETWTGEWWKFGGGGTAWDSIVYDQELDQILVGVGNGSPWNHSIRSPDGGDNLFLSSIVALEPDTGEYRWHYQQVPAENWDYTATQHIMLADMEIDGKQRKVIWQAPKNGFFFIIDRTNGELLSAEPFADINWATHYDMETGRPVETEIARYQERDGSDIIKPSSIGAHNWQPMAHHPETGLVYIPAMESAFQYHALDDYQHQAGHWNIGVHDPKPEGMPHDLVQALLRKVTTGHLLAWDPYSQSEKWRVPHSQVWNGGVLATAGNLVFQGTGDGEFFAFDARDGQKLWQFIAQTGIVAAPVTYSVDGEQYVAVAAGRGGVFSLAGGIEPEVMTPPKSRILIFKLGGTQSLPPLSKEYEWPELPPMPDVTDEQLEQGMQLYHQYCAGCHGYNVVSNAAIPDLRRMHPVFHQQFHAIVLDGNLKGLGMVGFDDVLDDGDVDNIHAYILSRAYEDQAVRSQPSWWRSIKQWFFNLLAAIIAFFI